MQYMILIYETLQDFEARNAHGPYVEAWRAYHQEIVKSGAYVGGEPLSPPASATTLRVKAGAVHVQDGPYAETKEQIGGFMILELPSLDAALGWAARCPAAATGAMEIRPVAPEVRENIVNG